eukprot:gene30600-35611_t
MSDFKHEFVEERELKGPTALLASRGMGAFRRACMSFIGLGSVSDYCLHNCPVPTLVVKFPNGRVPFPDCSHPWTPCEWDLPMLGWRATGAQAGNRKGQASRMHTQVILDEGMALAVKQGVQAAQIITKVMEPDTNGAAEVGECICTYAKDQGSQLIVSGCRGLGAMSRQRA